MRPDLASATDGAGRTPLHICAARRLSGPPGAAAVLATARALLEAGADVNAVHAIRDDGEVFPATPLWYALAWGRNRPLAAYLLRRGARPHHCLFALVFANDLASARLLRRHGAEVDEAFHGETPLIYAARLRRDRFVEWLLREGADPNARDRRGFTVLHHAVRHRLPAATLRCLLRQGANVHVVAEGGVSVAQLATRAQQRLLGLDGAGSTRSPRGRSR